MSGGCALCDTPGGEVLWADERVRVVWPAEADHPGLCRVVLQAHVAEMTELARSERDALMTAVYALEEALRELLAPDKMNLASFGNRIAHLHWHVIPRFTDDPHFPAAIWDVRVRPNPRPVPSDFAPRLSAALTRRLSPGVA